MANHKSSIKRIRQTETRRIRNRYHSKTMRNALKRFRSLQDKNEAEKDFPKLVALIDKMAKRNVIHKNNAANLKSKLAKQLNSLA